MEKDKECETIDVHLFCKTAPKRKGSGENEHSLSSFYVRERVDACLSVACFVTGTAAPYF